MLSAASLPPPPSWVAGLPSYLDTTQPWSFLLCCLICRDMLSDLDKAEPITEKTLKRGP